VLPLEIMGTVMFQCFNTATASDPTLARGFERFEKLASAERAAHEIVNFDLSSLAI
jgi:hypothetical protein